MFNFDAAKKALGFGTQKQRSSSNISDSDSIVKIPTKEVIEAQQDKEVKAEAEADGFIAVLEPDPEEVEVTENAVDDKLYQSAKEEDKKNEYDMPTKAEAKKAKTKFQKQKKKAREFVNIPKS